MIKKGHGKKEKKEAENDKGCCDHNYTKCTRNNSFRNRHTKYLTKKEIQFLKVTT